MKRFVEGVDRGQGSMFPARLEDWIGEDHPVRVIAVFVDELDLGGLGFGRVEPRATGRPSYHPSVLPKLYIYGYLNRVQPSRRLEQIEASVERYLHQPDSAGRQEPLLARTATTARLKDKIAKLKEEMRRLGKLEVRRLAAPDQQISLTGPQARQRYPQENRRILA